MSQQLPTTLMNQLSPRVRKHRGSRRQQSVPRASLSVSPRRSSRIQSRQRSISIPQTLGSYYELQSPLQQPPTDPSTLQPLEAPLYTRVPSSRPIEASTLVPLRAQAQEYSPLPQKHNLQTRKRGSNTSIETGTERPLKRARLTKDNLRLFQNMGQEARKPFRKISTRSLTSATTTTDDDPGLQPHQPKSRSSYSGTKSTRSKQTTSTTDSGFPDIAFQNGILNPICSKPPLTLKSHQERIERSRETVSPSESDYHHFASAIRRAPNEASVLIETSVLLKRYDEPGYQRSYNQAFSNFPKNVGFNNDLSAAQPDMVEGLDMPEFDPFPVREKLGGAATVYSGPQATTLPHLAGEWKGPGKDMILAQTQAGYDGACMVYGRNKARSFLNSPDPTSHAYVHTFTTDGTTLNTFVHYSSESEGQVKYHQYPTSSSFLISSYEDFKKCRRRLRNLQDDAKETSEKLRDELKEKWLVHQCRPLASTSVLATDENDDQEDGEDDPNSQLLKEFSYYTSLKSQDIYDQPNTQEPLTLDSEYNHATNSLEVLTAGDKYNLNTSHLHNTNSEDDPSAASMYSPITPPYSSGNVSLPNEPQRPSFTAPTDLEGVNDSNTRRHKITRKQRNHGDNAKTAKPPRRT